MATTLTILSELYATYKTIELLSTTTKTVTTTVSSNAWQPVQWQGLSSDGATLIKTKTGIYDSNKSNYYFFDAVFHEDHNQTVQMTEHPVQTGGNVVDHAFMMPATLSLEIGMSDAMLSLVSSEWDSKEGLTKSVNAYRTLLVLQQNRLPLTIHTRLKQYENMVIEQITAADDYRTQNGLRATINFKQLLVATVATTTSALSQVTGTTNNGTVNATSA